MSFNCEGKGLQIAIHIVYSTHVQLLMFSHVIYYEGMWSTKQ